MHLLSIKRSKWKHPRAQKLCYNAFEITELTGLLCNGGKRVDQHHPRGRFNGALWFEHQVQSRTRAALTERGSHASTRSREYKDEYARQLALFRAERAEIKRRKAAKYAAILEKMDQTRQNA